MGFKFNPFSGTFDQTGSGGGASYIDGEVATYNDLPLDGTAALNSAWLVREASGVWPVSRKQAGIYIRTATAGSSRDADYTYAGTMPDVFSDAVFTLYDEASTTRTGQFNLGSITAGQNRVLTWPDSNGTIARTEDFAAPPAIGNTTRNTGAFTTLSATGQASFSDQITGANATATPPTTTTAAKGLQFALLGGSVGNTAAIYGSHGGTSTLGIGIANSSAGSITQVAAFTSTGLSVNGGTVTASAPVLDLSQTWNNSGVTFTGFRFNVTNTASGSSSLLADFQVGGATQFSVSRAGTIRTQSDLFVADNATSAVQIGNSPRITLNGTDGTFLALHANHEIRWATGRSDQAAVNPSLILVRDGASDVLAQRRTTNAQESRLYGTFTSSTNYQRMTVKSVRQTLSALSGASATTTGTFIPDGAVVVGVTTRVTTLLTGATGYTIGDGTDADRWGDITGTAIGTTSDNRDWTAGTIECFTAGGNVTLTAKTANFTAGAIEVCVFYLAGEAD